MGNHRCSCPHPTSWHPQVRLRHGAVLFPSSFPWFYTVVLFFLFFCNFLGAPHILGKA